VNKFDIKYNTFQTVFIGGGTPSTIEIKFYQKLFKIINPYLKSNIEITTEANPNSAKKDWLKGMIDLGVYRFSFGVQSFNTEKLKYLGRNHTTKEAINCVENSFNLGVNNISLDLMYDTIKDNKSLIEKDLDIVLNLPINHLSLYSLTIEKNTKFYNINENSLENLDLTHFIFDKVSLKLPQYEISNFGTYMSKHNLGYWQYKEYLGVGSGEVGYLNHQDFIQIVI
jgi:oxygen-independent coproporphyrinogen-3 oxidase